MVLLGTANTVSTHTVFFKRLWNCNCTARLSLKDITVRLSMFDGPMMLPMRTAIGTVKPCLGSAC